MPSGTFTLKATASDADGRVTSVVFYNGCERIGEASSAPWQLVVPNLAAGRYTFSARAIDDRGGATLATSAAYDVKSSASPPVANKLPQVSIATPANNAYFV